MKRKSGVRVSKILKKKRCFGFNKIKKNKRENKRENKKGK
jgi:hypothetical protein